LLNGISRGRRVGKIDDERCGSDAGGRELGAPLLQPSGTPRQKGAAEPFGSERAGGRSADAWASTCNDDDWLHGTRLPSGNILIAEG